jgi:hypothetical protein
MSVIEARPDGAGGPPLPATIAESPRRRHCRAWLLAAAVLVLVLAVIGLLLGKAAVYQPLSRGGLSLDAPFPGMPPGVGIKVVNNFALLGGDYYVPPQRGEFSFGLSIANSGSRPITIEAVTTSADPADSTYPIRLAGPVLYTTDMGRPGTPKTHILRNLALGPGQEIFIGIPLRTWPCGNNEGWVTDPAFYVKEHFLFFTHTVAVPWSANGAKLIMHNPGGIPGKTGTICAPQ